MIRSAAVAVQRVELVGNEVVETGDIRFGAEITTNLGVGAANTDNIVHPVGERVEVAGAKFAALRAARSEVAAFVGFVAGKVDRVNEPPFSKADLRAARRRLVGSGLNAQAQQQMAHTFR
jgi:hypothetical protein